MSDHSIKVLTATRKDVKPRTNLAHWRAATLILVHVLIAVHIAHWLIAGRTLAPLELNEVMYTLELGIVTAGFLFMTTTVAATLVAGRFFCSWGCHILALQDLSAWILRKLHIKPKAIRSRALSWIPAAAAVYMFVWPQIHRLWIGQAAPGLHVTTDADGWASFTTEHFWRNLPGLWISLLTFAICGFVIVYILGSRGFCTYGCPYGAVFRAADRLAPGRIRLTGDCQACGTCTAVCSSHVRVHEELNRYGMVVDPACLKDFDCVSACPSRAIGFGLGRPAILKRVQRSVRVRKEYDFSLGEEVFLLLVFAAVLLIYRGLYDRVPFLMTLGLGGIVGYASVVFLRLIRRPTARLNRWPLKIQGRLAPAGYVYAAVMCGFALFTAHSALIRYHTAQGMRQWKTATISPGGVDLASAVSHLEFADSWGLLDCDRIDRALADMYARQSRWGDAVSRLERVLNHSPGDLAAHLRLASAYAKQGRTDDALAEWQRALLLDPKRPETHYEMAAFHHEGGRLAEAVAHLAEAVRLRPTYAAAHFELGTTLIEVGDTADGIVHLRRAIDIEPEFADAYYNLAVALGMIGRVQEARQEIERAYELQPNDRQTQALRQHLGMVARSAVHDTMPR